MEYLDDWIFPAFEAQLVRGLCYLNSKGFWASVASRFLYCSAAAIKFASKYLGTFSMEPFGCFHLEMTRPVLWEISQFGTIFWHHVHSCSFNIQDHQLPPYQSVIPTTPSLPGLVHGRLDSSSVIFKDLILWCSTGIYRILLNVFDGFLGSIWLPSISPLKVAGKMIFLFHRWDMLVPRRVIIHELHPYVNVSILFLVSVLHVPISVLSYIAVGICLMAGYLNTSLFESSKTW